MFPLPFSIFRHIVFPFNLREFQELLLDLNQGTRHKFRLLLTRAFLQVSTRCANRF